MAYRFPLSGMLVWGAWVVAGIVGTVLPQMGGALGWVGPLNQVGNLWIGVGVDAAIVTFPQYIVLRLLIGHSSLGSPIWIPLSVVAWLAAYVASSVSAEKITHALLSVGAVQALTPGPFPFLTLITGVESIVLAAFLGLAQGFLLGRIFVARSAARLWLVGNLVAAVVVWIVIQIRTDSLSNQSNQTSVDLLLPIATFGALYAAVTGMVLVALSRHDVNVDRIDSTQALDQR